ncbi:MAG: hypothetical protein AAGE84_20585 [Cyanobacteria bacterium P01_G01_bin.39]
MPGYGIISLILLAEGLRPIEQTNIGKWRGVFSDQALQTIPDVTKGLANKLGYGL